MRFGRVQVGEVPRGAASKPRREPADAVALHPAHELAHGGAGLADVGGLGDAAVMT